MHEVLQAAVEATGATYGAFGVLDDTGAAFERFVVVGMDAAVRKQIDQLPVGGGVLGVLLERPEPLRLADLTAHPRAVGFPPGHPTMHSFLGVPVRVDGAVFGHLFLTVKRGGGAFTEADEAAATALAAELTPTTTAPLPIDRCRRRALTRRWRRRRGSARGAPSSAAWAPGCSGGSRSRGHRRCRPTTRPPLR